MKWMEHFLASGAMAGKITCPNKKCGAKLGNYDWAGVCCSCKEWVTPVSDGGVLQIVSFLRVFRPTMTLLCLVRGFVYTDLRWMRWYEEVD
jgi:hypothetical protein